MSSLKQKSISGVIWALTEKFSATGVKAFLGIILARLLTPEDFGLIGMITVFFVIAEVFVDSGFGIAYIQKKQINDDDANTVFIINLAISVILYILLFFSAPLIASFYNQPQLVLLLRVMAFVIIINAFNIIQRAKIIRGVEFKSLTKITVFSSILSGALAIFAAFCGMGVWALVLQSFCSRLFIAAGFWFISDFRPQWRFSRQSFREMFSFGSWMLFSNIIRTFFDNIYVFVIGKYFPVAQLGFYSKAKQFVQLSSNNIAGAIGSVAFPVYSSLQDDRVKLKNAMKKFIQHTMIIIVPLLAYLIIVAKPLFLVLLTNKWAPMIPFFQILCCAGVIHPLNHINAQSLIALGESSLSFNIELGRNALRIFNIFISFQHGIIYMLFGELLISIIFFFINAWFSKKFTDYGAYDQIMDIWRILFGGIVALFVAMSVNLFIDNLTLKLISGLIITGITYLLIEYLVNREMLNSSIRVFNSLWKS